MNEERRPPRGESGDHNGWLADPSIAHRKAWAARVNGWAAEGTGRGAVAVWGVTKRNDGALVCNCPRGVQCKAAGKHPTRADWPTIAPAGPQMLDACNVGTRTGAGLLIVDQDGEEGAQSWKRLLEHAGADEPRTVVVETARGFQRYFRVPDGPDAELLRTAADVHSGIDLRWTGGQGVGPGSRHASGAVYRVAEDTADERPAEIPAALLAALVEPGRAKGREQRERLDAPTTVPRESSREATAAALEGLAWTISEASEMPEGDCDRYGRGWHAISIACTARLASLVKGAHVTEGEAEAFLTSLPPLDGMLVAFRGAMRRPDIAPGDPYSTHEPEAEFPEGDDGGEVWTATPVLAHVRAAAWSRGVGPWAVLAEALARVLAATPPTLRTPERGGDCGGSLNLIAFSVAPPSIGKGESSACARNLFTRPAAFGAEIVEGADFDYPDGPTTSIGTGEGLVAEFVMRADKKAPLVQYRTRVLLRSSEVSEVRAKGSDRKGTTLLSYLRMIVMGEPLGSSTSDPMLSKTVREHAYRCCTIVHAQPEALEWVLDDAGEGLPQRIVWADPLVDLPDDGEHPWPGSLPWTAPAATQAPQPTPMQAPAEVVEWLREIHLAKTRRAAEAPLGAVEHLAADPYVTDPLLGHAPFLRVKIACALALLHQRSAVTEEDWRLSDVVMRHSIRTLRRVQAHHEERRAALRAAQGTHAADVDRARGDRAAEHERADIEAARERIVTVLARAEGQTLTRRALERSVGKHGSPARRGFEEGLSELADGDVVALVESENARSKGSVRLLKGPR